MLQPLSKRSLHDQQARCFDPGGKRRFPSRLAVRPRRGGPHPAVTMAYGFGGAIHHGLEPFAVTFAEAGFVVLMHDHRGFGRSGGEPPRHTQGLQGRRSASESSAGSGRCGGKAGVAQVVVETARRIPAPRADLELCAIHLWNLRETFLFSGGRSLSVIRCTPTPRRPDIPATFDRRFPRPSRRPARLTRNGPHS